jgi:hypothetical protein
MDKGEQTGLSKLLQDLGFRWTNISSQKSCDMVKKESQLCIRMKFISFHLKYQGTHEVMILWHVDLLLGNNSDISNYTTAAVK